ncbi:hypothetical protein SDC49_11255 [Lactobacillus sp. R2/2]|nr:hypothetical protein [Lactobacillus sp. R2/2]
MADKLRKYLVDEYALTQNNSKNHVFQNYYNMLKTTKIYIVYF